ncbi:hypothetical protein QBC44DRAFT_402525 [Cladorrhinum sp. PSN332]|nr:hypothetical protein QBC44DRAFT_402525 [Cladorrhinum sp. PSN332]
MEQSPVDRAFGTYELLESILSHVGDVDPRDVIRLQLVSRSWNQIIRDSPALQEACWYRPQRDIAGGASEIKGPWALNPAFMSLGFTLKQLKSRKQKQGDFDLKRRIYDKPGSWTKMLATQPPTKWIEIACDGDYSGDETMFYLAESMTGEGLLMGDVMAVLGEAQNRQECGLDRWAGVRHYEGSISPLQVESTIPDMMAAIKNDGYEYNEWSEVLELMPTDVSVRVAVAQAWGSGSFPGFSMRRVEGRAENDFLHELIVHRMAWAEDEEPYRWDGQDHGTDSGPPVCEEGGEYKANLVVVRHYDDRSGYLKDKRHVYRLLSDV